MTDEERKERKHARWRKWYAANGDAVRKRKRKMRKANLEKERQRERNWYAANREKICEQKRKYRKANPEAHRAALSKWRKANPEKQRNDCRKFQFMHPGYSRKYKRRYHEQAAIAVQICRQLGIPLINNTRNDGRPLALEIIRQLGIYDELKHQLQQEGLT